MRLGSTGEALAQVQSILQTRFLDTSEHIEARMLEAFLLARSGETREAARVIAQVKDSLCDDVSANLECEVWFVDSAILFGSQRYEHSEKAAWNSVHADLDLRAKGVASDSLSVTPIATIKARALQIIGLIRASQERYHEHYRILREAIVMSKTSPYEDVYVTSNLYVTRSYYARDFGTISDIVEIELLPYHAWPDDFSELKFEIETCLASLYSLAGDNEALEQSLRRARSVTRSDVNRLSLMADEACFARQRRDRGILRSQLLSATKLADSIDWNTDIERYALLSFARELAFVDPLKAREYVELFEGLSSTVNPLIVVDRRTKADDDFSIALVLLANDETERAIKLLLDCFETWTSVGYRWHAAEAAIELAAIVDPKHFVDYALRESEPYPASWLRSRALEACTRLNQRSMSPVTVEMPRIM